MNNQTINSDAVAYLKAFLAPEVEILDLQIIGKWLRATLSSGIYFSVPSNSK